MHLRLQFIVVTSLLVTSSAAEEDGTSELPIERYIFTVLTDPQAPGVAGQVQVYANLITKISTLVGREKWMVVLPPIPCKQCTNVTALSGPKGERLVRWNPLAFDTEQMSKVQRVQDYYDYIKHNNGTPASKPTELLIQVDGVECPDLTTSKKKSEHVYPDLFSSGRKCVAPENLAKIIKQELQDNDIYISHAHRLPSVPETGTMEEITRWWTVRRSMRHAGWTVTLGKSYLDFSRIKYSDNAAGIPQYKDWKDVHGIDTEHHYTAKGGNFLCIQLTDTDLVNDTEVGIKKPRSKILSIYDLRTPQFQEVITQVRKHLDELTEPTIFFLNGGTFEDEKPDDVTLLASKAKSTNSPGGEIGLAIINQETCVRAQHFFASTESAVPGRAQARARSVAEQREILGLPTDSNWKRLCKSHEDPPCFQPVIRKIVMEREFSKIVPPRLRKTTIYSKPVPVRSEL